ncbi:MAG: lipid II flippase MurJ, partial [Kiloniellales bacterium]
VGLALATALAAWLNAGVLALLLRRRDFLTLDQRFRSRLPRMLTASLAMGLLLWGVAQALAPWFGSAVPQGIAGLVLLVALGLASYGALALAFGAVTRNELRSLIKRGPKPA